MFTFIKSENDLKKLQWIIHACGAVSVGLTAMVAYWLFFIQTESYARTWQQTYETDTELINQEHEIHNQLQDARQELEQLEERLSELTALIPDRPEESHFLAQLSELAATTGLQIRDFRPGDSEQSNQVHQLSVQLTGSGDYECLCHFLDGIQSLERLTHVSRLKVDPAAEDGLHPVDMKLTIFFANDSSVTQVAKQ